MFENFTKKMGDIAQNAVKKSSGIAQNAVKISSDFAQNAAKKSGEFAQTAAKKSGEMVEVTKLNMSMTSEENSIEKLYTELGELCYSSIQAGTELDGSISEVCQKIKAHKDAIAEIKGKIKSIKNDEE